MAEYDRSETKPTTMEANIALNNGNIKEAQRIILRCSCNKIVVHFKGK